MLAIVAFALVVTGLFWRAYNQEAITTPASAVVPVSKAEPVALAPASTPLPAAEVSKSLAAMESTVEAPSPAANPPAVAVAAPAMQPAPPRLQAIFFNKSQPSAIIDGRTVYVGSRIGDFRVATITSGSATLVSGATTNILRFEE
jgi:hypothetical protein